MAGNMASVLIQKEIVQKNIKHYYMQQWRSVKNSANMPRMPQDVNTVCTLLHAKRTLNALAGELRVGIMAFSVFSSRKKVSSFV